MSNLRPRIAMYAEFLEAFSRLQAEQRKKVQRFLEKFVENPTSRAINYERIHDMRDEKVRTVRIDQTYRAIVLHPPKGDVYVLAWVDHHDDAMAWAKNKRFDVHPETGAIQVFEESLGSLLGASAQMAPVPAATGLFQRVSDKDLVRTGLHPMLVPAVRSLQSEDDFLALHGQLAEEAYEGLFHLLTGGSIETLLWEREQRKAAAVDVDRDDYVSALAQPDSQRRFVEIGSIDELNAILEAPLERWRVFLHPSQRQLVGRNFSGPARVQGGAGTGKTVVLLHRAAHMARHVFTAADDRLLITTYTRTLAQSIAQNLRNLCPDVADRIVVQNLHAWALEFVRHNGIDPQVATAEDRARCWEEALRDGDTEGFVPGFFQAEWEAVMAAQGLTTQDGYLQASRMGRDVPLSRGQRLRVWSVFERYLDALERRRLVEFEQVLEMATGLLENMDEPPFRSVLVDEAQDLGPAEFRLIRAATATGRNDLFIVGDSFQRIFRRKVVLSRSGVHVRGRSTILKINYRTTEQIRNWAVELLIEQAVQDLDGEAADLDGYISERQGLSPEFHRFDTVQEEGAYLAKRIRALAESSEPESICVVARSADLLDHYERSLRHAQVPVTRLTRDHDAGNGVRLATMHRVKGLEFKHVILAGLNEGRIPFTPPGRVLDDEELLAERCLLYVAATRARDTLLTTCHGAPSRLLGPR